MAKQKQAGDEIRYQLRVTKDRVELRNGSALGGPDATAVKGLPAKMVRFEERRECPNAKDWYYRHEFGKELGPRMLEALEFGTRQAGGPTPQSYVFHRRG